MRALVLLAALLIGLASPARAADDVTAAQGVIRSQAEAFARDDAQAAYSYAAPALHGMFPQADIFMVFLRGRPPCSVTGIRRGSSFKASLKVGRCG